ncbi:PP2C family serine/threonine-protein phosphatase [Chlorogloeopsis sp. ULAP01]|uniref:PP2C family serine/threonine-protein phosphatase n=1 Tax=Chlorogloeopsis sp. ULAP01 TaxID=3056483 RepID=UPI0025AAE55D|nr:PP2C family serine/threonine-protein phosphatase [Chlorogloeopsis sp. ULAP01]MDM9381007.1 PP2C family serine/threonine-protein phosphatase [Chlorogloeopsis sp. ULAP01]
MKTSIKIPQWRVVAASVCGTSHIKNKQLCQDAHHFLILPDNVLVVAAADGAGSAILGKVGAMVATETAVETISRKETNQAALEDDAVVRSLLMESILTAKTAVEEEAVACNKKPHDLASTLIVVIATPGLVAVAQIGDGVAVVKDSMGNLSALTTPDNGEYMNETTFLVSPGAIERVQVKILRQSVVNLGVITDGLQWLAMNMAISAPHKPFFLPLFDFVANADDKIVAKEQLVKFLRSERIAQRTDDDLTLIVAALTD